MTTTASHLCGTSAGYHRHRRHGENPCAPCKAAHAARTTATKTAAHTAARLTAVDFALAHPPTVGPVVVLPAPAGGWAAVCVSPNCGAAHQVFAGRSLRAAEQAADYHLKGLNTPTRTRRKAAA